MNLKSLIETLDANKECSLFVMLPSGKFVPDHFHVTEVGKIQKTFVDCGGTRRENICCAIQIWTANDVEHRLQAGKLASILKLGQNLGISDDWPVEVEYGEDAASYYQLSSVSVAAKQVILFLVGKKTNCLAPDKCGVSGCC